MSKQKHTPGPWSVGDRKPYVEVWGPMRNGSSPILATMEHEPREANVRVMAAAAELLEAAQLLEKAETAHANCTECEGEDVPELCPKCFPFFDDARIKRRLAIAKATGKP